MSARGFSLSRLDTGHVLAIAGFMALPSCIFSVPFMAPLLIAAALAVLILGWRREGRWPEPSRPLLLLLGSVVAYGALSAFWAVDARLSLILAARLLGLFIAGAVLLDGARRLSAQERRRFERAFLAGFLLGLAFMLAEILTQADFIRALRETALVKDIIGEQRPLYFTSYFNRVATFVGLLAWPAALIARRRAGAMPALALVLVSLVAVELSHSETAQLAFLSAGAVWLLARALPRGAAAALGVAIALAIAIAPLALRSSVIGWTPDVLATPGKAPSLEHRLAIWDFATSRIDQKPLLGWGLNSSRVIPGGHEKFANNAELMPLHPHDMALQLWLELGAVGALWGMVLALLVTRAAGRLRGRPESQAFLLAMIAAAAINGTAGYDLWHPWWLSFLWLSAAFAAAALEDSPGASPPHRPSL